LLGGRAANHFDDDRLLVHDVDRALIYEVPLLEALACLTHGCGQERPSVAFEALGLLLP
jgi:hypothetical protein